MKYTIKRHKTLPNNPLVHIYIKRINNNRLAFERKDGYKLELQKSETMKLFDSTKEINRQDKEWRKFNES